MTLAHATDEAPEKLARFADVSHQYAVDLMPLDDLEPAASQHGSPIPDTVRPAPIAAERKTPSAPGAPPPPAPDLTPEEVGTPQRIRFDGRRVKGDVWRGPGAGS